MPITLETSPAVNVWYMRYWQVGEVPEEEVPRQGGTQRQTYICTACEVKNNARTGGRIIYEVLVGLLACIKD